MHQISSKSYKLLIGSRITLFIFGMCFDSSHIHRLSNALVFVYIENNHLAGGPPLVVHLYSIANLSDRSPLCKLQFRMLLAYISLPLQIKNFI